MATLTTTPQRTETGRFLRFLTVGASGTVLDFLTLTLLKEAFLLPTLIANTIAFCVGLVNNFTWNRLWTFSDVRNGSLTRQFMQFAAISIIGLTLNNVIITVLETPFGTLFGLEDYGYLPAKLVATGIVFFWNFAANRYWTFNTKNTNEKGKAQ